MAKKKFSLGCLAIALAFGMTALDCSNGNGNGNGDDWNWLNSVNWYTRQPTAAELAPFGLTVAQFIYIRDAASGGFRGWRTVDGTLITLEVLEMAWTGRTVTNYGHVVTAMYNIGFTTDSEYDYNGEWFTWQGYSANASAGLDLYAVRYEYGGYFMPARTLLMTIRNPN